MKITVLVCTYNRHILLRQCLEALIDNTLEKPDEVVVVNGGNNQADDVIKSFQDRKDVEVKLIKIVNKNLAASRNAGLAYCSGDIIALTDDDVQVAPDWIINIKQLHKAHFESGVIGGKIISAGKRLLDKVADLVIFPFPNKAGYIRTVAGANAAYKKRAIEEVGKFDETLFRGEDVDYNWRISNKGYKIYYNPQLEVFHRHRANWRGLVKQIFMYGRAYYLVRSKWREMYCIYPHSIKSIKDILKIGYFFLGILIEPFLCLRKVKNIYGKIIMLPLLIILQAVWRCGMIVERIITVNTSKHVIHK